MKVNILDAHDRYKHFVNQGFDIDLFIKNMTEKRPFGDHPFYIFGHGRTLGLDEKMDLFVTDHTLSMSNPSYIRKYQTMADVPETRLIWQPRLTKPKAADNSQLFKVYPGSDMVKTIWIIPKREFWPQYERGKVTESNIIQESIAAFLNSPEKLEAPEPDDLSDDAINAIYAQIALAAKPRMPF